MRKHWVCASEPFMPPKHLRIQVEDFVEKNFLSLDDFEVFFSVDDKPFQAGTDNKSRKWIRRPCRFLDNVFLIKGMTYITSFWILGQNSERLKVLFHIAVVHRMIFLFLTTKISWWHSRSRVSSWNRCPVQVILDIWLAKVEPAPRLSKSVFVTEYPLPAKAWGWVWWAASHSPLLSWTVASYDFY